MHQCVFNYFVIVFSLNMIFVRWWFYMAVIGLVNYKNSLLLIFLLSLFCFISSLTIQIFFKEQPCLLCLFTRYGFLIVSIICVFTLKYFDRKNVVFLPIFSLVLLFFLSFYHLGIENHWWVAPKSCRTILPTLQEIHSNTNPISNTRPSCDVVNFKILGVSITLISFVISGLLCWLSSITTILHLYKNNNKLC